jgi:sphingosine kinase
MQFPLALPTDGYVDLVIQHKTSRAELLTVMDLAPSGQFYFLDKVQYVKARGYRVTPLNDSGVMGVDGEPLPYKAFEVEVHPSLGRIMSPTGQYVNVFAGVKLS